LDEPGFRRAVLYDSLVSKDNLYARRRLASYRDDAWDALPEWNPEVSLVRAADGRSSSVLRFTRGETREAALRELGKRAFYTYPLQVVPYVSAALERADVEARYGLALHEGRRGELVFVKTSDGRTSPAYTCATCHSAEVGGVWISGVPNRKLRVDLLLADAGVRTPSWGPGRVDVTADDVVNPTAIPDLRPTPFHEHLHRAGTVRNSLLGLAIRLETLAITSLDERARPPREVALGLALYVWSLGETLAPVPREGAGQEVFLRTCGECHRGEALSGPAVPYARVGGAPAIFESPERGTGNARVPSLRGVATRAPLLSSGAVQTLEQLVSPERTDDAHPFGRELSESDRRELLEWLSRLD
jgi:mono/diheme cytochrome c family protein